MKASIPLIAFMSACVLVFGLGYYFSDYLLGTLEIMIRAAADHDIPKDLK